MSLLGQGKKPKWRVRYSDGNVTELMNKKTAKDFVAIWGGKIERVVYEKGAGDEDNSVV
jgi:hypothetical protein